MSFKEWRTSKTGVETSKCPVPVFLTTFLICQGGGGEQGVCERERERETQSTLE
jgi:hypothetical protein